MAHVSPSRRASPTVIDLNAMIAEGGCWSGASEEKITAEACGLSFAGRGGGDG
jgi:hypothetical protein